MAAHDISSATRARTALWRLQALRSAAVNEKLFQAEAESATPNKAGTAPISRKSAECASGLPPSMERRQLAELGGVSDVGTGRVLFDKTTTSLARIHHGLCNSQEPAPDDGSRLVHLNVFDTINQLHRREADLRVQLQLQGSWGRIRDENRTLERHVKVAQQAAPRRAPSCACMVSAVFCNDSGVPWVPISMFAEHSPRTPHSGVQRSPPTTAFMEGMKRASAFPSPFGHVFRFRPVESRTLHGTSPSTQKHQAPEAAELAEPRHSLTVALPVAMAVPPRPKMIAKLPMRPSNIVSSASPTLTPVTAFDRSTLPDRNVTWLVSVSDDLKKDHQGLMVSCPILFSSLGAVSTTAPLACKSCRTPDSCR
ncbi:hypothetical protein IWX47DRAFT_845407 [Phyllosticta citricarpa]